jgi:1,4-alpha-glucan branching enzyme
MPPSLCPETNADKLRKSLRNSNPAKLCIYICSAQNLELKDRRMINDLWYKNAVIYCLSVATYMDANGYGTGDFQGLMRRLDYLQGLGVTAIWLMPS